MAKQMTAADGERPSPRSYSISELCKLVPTRVVLRVDSVDGDDIDVEVLMVDKMEHLINLFEKCRADWLHAYVNCEQGIANDISDEFVRVRLYVSHDGHRDQAVFLIYNLSKEDRHALKRALKKLHKLYRQT